MLYIRPQEATDKFLFQEMEAQDLDLSPLRGENKVFGTPRMYTSSKRFK